MTYAAGKRLPPRLVGAIRTYLSSRTTQRPVSITRMMRTTRYAIPDLLVSDDELAELIARELISEGSDVDFDRTRQNQGLAAVPLDLEHS